MSKKKNVNKDIWKEFCQKELNDFEQYMGYTKENIKKIGVNKFIKAMGLRDVNDVNKWRTDRVHIVPCCCCRKEFALFELDFGICPKCLKSFDTSRLNNFINVAVATTYQTYTEAVAEVYFTPELRDKFKHKTLKQYINNILDAGTIVSDMNAFQGFKQAINTGKLQSFIRQLLKSSKLDKQSIVLLQKVQSLTKDKTDKNEQLTILKTVLL